MSKLIIDGVEEEIEKEEVMDLFREDLENLVESGMPINEAYTEANHRLCENNEAEMFVTAWMGVINLTNGHV